MTNNEATNRVSKYFDQTINICFWVSKGCSSEMILEQISLQGQNFITITNTILKCSISYSTINVVDHPIIYSNIVEMTHLILGLLVAVYIYSKRFL